MTSDKAHQDPDFGERADSRPGHELHAARERSGDSVETMAERLRLSVSQLEALERDDYAELPPPAFVRGYLRAYARELGLEPERFVAAYDATGVSGNDPELRVATSAQEPASGHGPVVGLLLIALVAVGGMGAWWYQQRLAAPLTGEAVEGEESSQAGEADGGEASEADSASETAADDAADASADDGASNGADEAESEATASASAETDGGDAGAAEESVDETDAAAAQTGDDAATSETGVAATGEGVSGDGATTPGDNTTAATTEASAETAGADGTSADAGSEDTTDADADAQASVDAAAASETSPAATDSPSQATTAAAESGPDQVVLEFAGRSWLEVSDSRDRDLVYTLYFGDEPVTLRGWAPFEIFLGNSPAVEVRFNGEAVDKSAFTRSDNTARFVVDEGGARAR